MWLFLEIKYIVRLRKSYFFENEAAYACANVPKYFTPHMSAIRSNTKNMVEKLVPDPFVKN